jgi:hypothetical protein
MRPKKSADELAKMIMQEARKHPDWSDIQSAAIIRKTQATQHDASWDAAFVMDGPRVVPAAAQQFARELAGKYDLV